MLAVDGQQLTAVLAHRRHEQGAAHHQGFFIGQQQTLACTRCRQARCQACRTDDGTHHHLYLLMRSNGLQSLRATEHLGGQAVCFQLLCQLRGMGRTAHHGVVRAKFHALG